jgi:catechol 2,3-dioxygenase-like lactoylglutathione lyase family enzyme
LTTAKFVCSHLHFRSEDPEAAARFYCDNFGAEITSVTPFSNTKLFKLELNGQPLMTISGQDKSAGLVSGFEWANVDPLPGSTEPRYGLDHFGFEVDGDMDAVLGRLKANGVHFIIEPYTEPSGMICAFIEGPDHASVEIIKRP